MRERVFRGHVNGFLQSHIKRVLKLTEPHLAARLISLILFTAAAAAAQLCVFERKQEQTGIPPPLIKTSFSALYCRAPVSATHRTLLSHYGCAFSFFMVPLRGKNHLFFLSVMSLHHRMLKEA